MKKNINKILPIAVIAITLCLIVSCGPQNYYEKDHYREVFKKSWGTELPTSIKELYCYADVGRDSAYYCVFTAEKTDFSFAFGKLNEDDAKNFTNYYKGLTDAERTGFDKNYLIDFSHNISYKVFNLKLEKYGYVYETAFFAFDEDSQLLYIVDVST